MYNNKYKNVELKCRLVVDIIFKKILIKNKMEEISLVFTYYI